MCREHNGNFWFTYNHRLGVSIPVYCGCVNVYTIDFLEVYIYNGIIWSAFFNYSYRRGIIVMKNKKEQDIIVLKAIKKVLPSVVSEWNTKKLKLLESLYEQKFIKLFKDRQTQEKTKVVAPILDSIFARLMKKEITEFKIDESVGHDYIVNGEHYECKITFTSGNFWTGNRYSKKTPKHILLKFKLNNDGFITNMFAMMVNLDDCVSAWKKTSSSSAFSILTFLKEDYKKLNVIVGSLKVKTKKITPIVESM